MKVNFFSEKIKAKKIKGELQSKLNNILKTGHYTNSKYVKRFEKIFKNVFQSKYCVAVNNRRSTFIFDCS